MDEITVAITVSGEEFGLLRELAASIQMSPDALLQAAMKDVFANMKRRLRENKINAEIHEELSKEYGENFKTRINEKRSQVEQMTSAQKEQFQAYLSELEQKAKALLEAKTAASQES